VSACSLYTDTVIFNKRTGSVKYRIFTLLVLSQKNIMSNAIFEVSLGNFFNLLSSR
jgi:hypothetical protein